MNIVTLGCYFLYLSFTDCNYF